MATYDINVGIKDNTQTPTQTTSFFPLDKNDHVNFYNRGDAPLTVTFDAQKNPLCDGNIAAPDVIVVAAKTSTVGLKVCKGDYGDQFAYTAQIEGSAAEDPIVIIEKTKALSIDSVSLTIGIVAGLLAGFILAKLLIGGKTRTPA